MGWSISSQTNFQTGLLYFTNTSIKCQPNTGHINQSSGQFPSRLWHANSFSTWSRLLVYIVEIYNNTWKALRSTWVHPSTAPSHKQGVSIWRDSTPSLPCSKGETPSFYSCKMIRRLLLAFSSHTHASAGFLLLWLHGILTCETRRMIFRHTPPLFPHLSSLSKLLHPTVKHLVLTCDTAAQHPLKFTLRKTKTLTLWRRRWTLVSLGDKRLRSAPPAETQTISRPTQMPWISSQLPSARDL